MRTLVIAVVLVSVACGGGQSASPPPPPVSNSVAAAPPDAAPPSATEQAMATMRRFTDEMCACTTAECAKQVSDQLTEWSVKMAKEETEPPPMTEAEQKQATELGTQMGECMMRAMGMQPSQPQPAQPTP